MHSPGRRARRVRSVALSALLLMSGIGAARGEPMAAAAGVSPGGLDAVLTAAESCPTFSWAAPAAAGFELVVFRVEPETRSVAATRGAEVLSVELPGGARSWTPSAGRCLEPGGTYGWSVRALIEDFSTPWSVARLFRVSERPSATEVLRAQEILKRYLASSRRAPSRPGDVSLPVQALPESHGVAPLPAAPSGRSSTLLADTVTVDVEGGVEATAVRSLSGGVSTQGNIVADGELGTRDGVLETIALYLTAPGTLDREVQVWSPALNEVEIKRPSSTEADGKLLINRIFTDSLEVGVSGTIQAGLVSIGSFAASYEGTGGDGVAYVPLNGSDEMRLDTAGDRCATGFVTAVRFKVVDTNQAGVEVKCSN